MPFWPLSRSNLPKRTSPAWSAWLSPLLSLWWSVSAAQQPKSFKTDLASLLCLAMLPAPAGGPFLSLSSPNPPKRTSPASSAWLCSLLSLWWSVLASQQPESFKTDLASLLCWAVLFALPLVVRFGRSAAQILQNGPQQPKSSKTVLATLVSLAVLLALPLDLQILAENYICLAGSSGGPFWPLSSSNLPKRTSPAWSAWLSPLLSLCWSVSAAQQPKSFKTDLASLLCLAVLPAPAGGPFWRLSSPNPPKRTSPASSAWPCSLLSLWWSVLAAQQPESSKRTSQLAMLGCAPCSPSGVRFGRSAAQILQNGPRQLRLLGCAPCSPSLWWSVLAAQQPESFKTDLPSSPGRPFWPLSSPNPSKRTSQACYAGLCSLLSLWWSVLAAQQPKSSKTDLPNNRWMCTARFEPSIFRLRVLPSAD